MGDMMIFKLYESKEKCRAKGFHDTTEIYLSRFSDLFVEDGIKKIVIDSMSLFLFSAKDSLLNDMYEAVVNNYDYNKIIEILNKNDVIFFSLAMQAINYGKRTYNLIKNIDDCKEIHFSCNKDNLLEVLLTILIRNPRLDNALTSIFGLAPVKTTKKKVVLKEIKKKKINKNTKD